MTEQEAIALIDKILQAANQRRLTDVQSVVFLDTWAGRSYPDIAQQSGYERDYIKQVGSRLWRSLSQAVGEEVSKKNIHAVLRRYHQSQQGAEVSAIQYKLDWGEAITSTRFYERQEELQMLN
jgi:hypothetical protein